MLNLPLKVPSMEKVLQYIWAHRLWQPARLRTVDGRRLVVLDQGVLNRDAGPDFFNAKIRLDDELWSGDVEIHVKASDWYRHHHDSDQAYKSVILHVVEKDDAGVNLPGTDRKIPQLRMSCSNDFKQKFEHLVGNSVSMLPCSAELRNIGRINLMSWFTSLAYERLIAKSDRITEILQKNTANWEETCYIILARALGTGLNGEPFQRLALSVPLRIIGKHSDNLLAIESLLFGQAGFLVENHPDDPYYCALQREYAFMVNKFGLSAPENLNWKMARMRPANFPHRRIALLAHFLSGGFGLMSRLVQVETVDDVKALFRRELDGYWATHFNFSSREVAPKSLLSESTIESLVINVAVPMLYTYGIVQLNGRESDAIAERAVEWLEQLRPENNFITVMFAGAGIKCRNAFTSQALIQLRRNYCEAKKCIYCRIGHRLLASRVLCGQ